MIPLLNKLPVMQIYVTVLNVLKHSRGAELS